MDRVRITFALENFISNQQIEFKIYDKDDNLISIEYGNEWADTGVYYLEKNLNMNKQCYLVIATILNGGKKIAKRITKNDII